MALPLYNTIEAAKSRVCSIVHRCLCNPDQPPYWGWIFARVARHRLVMSVIQATHSPIPCCRAAPTSQGIPRFADRRHQTTRPLTGLRTRDLIDWPFSGIRPWWTSANDYVNFAKAKVSPKATSRNGPASFAATSPVSSAGTPPRTLRLWRNGRRLLTLSCTRFSTKAKVNLWPPRSRRHHAATQGKGRS